MSRRLWLGLLLAREVSLNLRKKLTGNHPVSPLRKEVSLTLLQILRPRHVCRSDRGVTLGPPQRLTASLDLLPGAVVLAHPLKCKRSQEQQPGHRALRIPRLSPRFLCPGPFPDEAGLGLPAKAEALLLRGAAVLSPLQNTPPNPELLGEVLDYHQNQRPSLEPPLAVVALGHPN